MFLRVIILIWASSSLSGVRPTVIPEKIRADGEPNTLIQKQFPEENFSFLIAGDNGGFPEPFYSTQLQRNVAARMAEQSQQHQCKFVLELGDNFYFLGVKDVFDRRWQGTFEDVYNAVSLYIPWYPTTGNHDWHGSVKAQIDYTQYSSRWTFPWYWYTLDHVFGSENIKMRIIMFETTIPCGFGARPDGIPLDDAMAEEQWIWLEEQLILGQDADYLIVTGHYPVYSAGSAGPSIPCLYNKLDPLLKKYKVQAYISGHDHDLQHLQNKDPEHILDYLVIGCSNFVTPYFVNAGSTVFKTVFTWAGWNNLLTGCFARADVSPENLKITYIDGNGAELHEIALPRRDKTVL